MEVVATAISKPKVYDPQNITLGTTSLPPIGYVMNREHAEKLASELGSMIVVPDDFTLQLDIDSEVDYNLLIQFRLPRLLTFCDIERVWFTESKSGNKHVYVRLKHKMNPAERIALQATLGSDLTREFLSMMRILGADINTGADRPTLMFEKPNAVEHVVYASDGWQPQLSTPVMGGNPSCLPVWKQS